MHGLLVPPPPQDLQPSRIRLKRDIGRAAEEEAMVPSAAADDDDPLTGLTDEERAEIMRRFATTTLSVGPSGVGDGARSLMRLRGTTPLDTRSSRESRWRIVPRRADTIATLTAMGIPDTATGTADYDQRGYDGRRIECAGGVLTVERYLSLGL